MADKFEGPMAGKQMLDLIKDGVEACYISISTFTQNRILMGKYEDRSEAL
jgi:hypothetical protein